MIGTTIQHYNILEKIGHGGMGVVYKAYDTRLERTVALKFLPEDLSTDEADRTRFLREARAASAINHPNVCTIYDLKEHEDEQFIVMEYIEGKTLKKLVVDNIQLPVEIIVDYAIQICQALMATHSRGILHRDIKSENIMVTPSGQVKVMDFGLALVKGSQRLTQSSSTLGTIAYMSPEQIEGKQVDARSDIFSFGVVLYEMLAGELPFHGENAAAMVYSILNDEPPPLDAHRPGISPALQSILSRSLEKNHNDRYQTANDIVLDLRRVKGDSAPVAENKYGAGRKASGKSKPASVNKLRLAVFAAFVFLSLVTALFVFKPFFAEQLPPMRIVPFVTSPNFETDPAISPDGNQIAFLGAANALSSLNLFVKLIGVGVPLKLTETSGKYASPSWSPDGRMIAFLRLDQETGIYQIPALGGAMQRLLAIDSTNMRSGLDWSADGAFMVYSDRNTAINSNGIFIFTLRNLEKRQLSFPPIGPLGDDKPVLSTDGKWVAFRRQFSYNTFDIFIVSVSDGSERRLTDDYLRLYDIAWSEDDAGLIFSSFRSGNCSLWRIPFKGGEPRPIDAGGDNPRLITVSKTGNKLAYAKGGARDVIWKGEFPQEGQVAVVSRLITTNRNHGVGRFSPDGKKIVFFSDASGISEIWICSSDGSNPLQLTDFGRPYSGAPRWSPDGRYIAFDSRPQGNSDIFMIKADGNELRRMTTDPSDDRIPTWSRDGRWLYFTTNRNGSFEIWKLPVAGGAAVQVWKEEGWVVSESADGKHLYYNDSIFRGKVWKLFLGNGEKQLILNNVDWANWSLVDDGIFYIDESPDGSNNHLMFHRFASKGAQKIARLTQQDIFSFDISPDRNSFLIHELIYEDNDIYVIENFR